MSDEVRPKLAQIPQPRDVPPVHNVVPKLEDDEEDRRPRPRPLQLGGGGVTLPSFQEAYGSAVAQFPTHPLPPPPQHYDSARPPPPRPYPDSPNGASRGPPPPPPPPGPPANGANDGYARMHPAEQPMYRENKDYYAYPYSHYPDRAPPPPQYWNQHQMPPNYQPAPPESAPRQRTSIACKYCRKRKIRCSGYQNTPDGKCTNCKKTGNDCVFQPVSSTTSTAFVPVSAIQGGVPPGTPLYGAFGQPLGPNGGRGPAGPPPNGSPAGPPNGHMNGGPPGPPPPGYGPASPNGPHAGYYQQHMPPHMEQNGPPPPQSAQGPPSSMGPRSLPLPYPQQGPPQHQGYPTEDPRRRNSQKRGREDDEPEYPPSRLPPPPPPPGYVHQNYYASFEDGSRIHTESVRRSPPSAPGSAVSPTSNGHRGYGTPAPPVLPPPPSMSSVGTDISVNSNGSIAGTAVTSPTERVHSRSPSGDAEDAASRSAAIDRYLQQPQYIARECDLNSGREIDRTMLNRLGNARPDSRPEHWAGQESPPLVRERA